MKYLKKLAKDSELDNLKEELADIAHDAWSGWMKYLFEKGNKNDDGTFTINKDSVERWERQMKTDYKDLSEKEKDSDRIEADKYLKAFRKYTNE